MTITAQECDEILSRDLATFERAVLNAVKVPLNQNQFDALVSFTFNVGAGNLQKSTLLRKLNAKDYRGAADQFTVWNKAAGKVMNGLVKRRADERALFLKPAPATVSEPEIVQPPATITKDEPIKPPGFWSSLLVMILSAFKRG